MTWSRSVRFLSVDAPGVLDALVGEDHAGWADSSIAIDDDAEAQISTVLAAASGIIDADAIGAGAWRLDIGGNANPDQQPTEGRAHECVTLTLAWIGHEIPADPPSAAVEDTTFGPITADGSDVVEGPPVVQVPAPPTEGPITADGSEVAAPEPDILAEPAAEGT